MCGSAGLSLVLSLSEHGGQNVYADPDAGEALSSAGLLATARIRSH